MPRQCTTCAIPYAIRTPVVAEALAGVLSGRKAAARLGVPPTSFHSHMANCVPREIANQSALAAHQGAPSASPASSAPFACEPVPDAPAPQPSRRGLILSPEDDAALSAPIAAPPVASAPVAPLPAPTPVATVAPAAPIAPPSLLATADDLHGRAMLILATAQTAGDLKTALMAIREARGLLDSRARLEERAGAAAGQAVPLVQSSEWGSARATILAALADHPDARLAVAAALSEAAP